MNPLTWVVEVPGFQTRYCRGFSTTFNTNAWAGRVQVCFARNPAPEMELGDTIELELRI